MKMKKQYRISAILVACLLLFSSVLYTGCVKGDDLDTDQLASGEVTLKSFGPSPVPRGGELRFIGTNLQRVTSIEIPGAEGITQISKISNNEIRIMVPQSAQPGLVKLNHADGSITTLTPVGYSEPISIASITPSSIKAGASITIEGEYLNLIEEVIFADGVHVAKANFVSQERGKIVVVVPVEARTGKVIVSNGADILSDGEEIPIWVYSESELVVTLPSITSIAPNPLKAGQELTITGTNFDLVEKVILPGGVEVPVSNATTTIKITTPAAIQEGLVKLVAKSGVEIESASLNLVKPVISLISNNVVKTANTFQYSEQTSIWFQKSYFKEQRWLKPILHIILQVKSF
jgi:hypothetical protein